MNNFHLLEHTADMGIEAQAATLPELFNQAALGLCHIVCDQFQPVRIQNCQVTVDGDDHLELMVNWLNEILYQIEVHRFIPVSFTIDRFSAHSLQATLTGGLETLATHGGLREVKAVTYHQLQLDYDKANQLWRSRIFVDL